MGYYDGDYYKKPSKVGYFLSSFVGIIFGAGIVLATIPHVSNDNATQNTSTKTNESVTAFSQKSENTTKVVTDVTGAVDKVIHSVVGISNIQKQTDLFHQSAGEQETGSGSGVIYKKSGNKAYIVTNNHVVEGADKLEITLSTGEKVNGSVRGTDIWSDLAVVEVDSNLIKDSDIATFGDSTNIKIGEPVIAVGNPLGLEFSGSVTEGIISGKNRSVPIDIDNDGVDDWESEVLQTDAAINPGNSGGALANAAGEVIGINSMKIAQDAVEGIGLSIPIQYALPIINDLEKYGKVNRPSIGVSLIDLSQVSETERESTLNLPTDLQEGVVVYQVSPNSPAEKSGLKEYDVITELDGNKVDSSSALRQFLYNHKKINDSLTITVYRNGKKLSLEVKLNKSL
jgi:serine protease Do